MPLLALGDECVRSVCEAEYSAGKEVTDGHALRAIVTTRQEGAGGGEDSNGDGDREKRFAFVRAQVECFTEDDMVTEGGCEQQGEERQRQDARRKMRQAVGDERDSEQQHKGAKGQQQS